MSSTSELPIVAVYESGEQAEAAIDQLWHSGFAKNQIGVFVPGVGLRPAHTRTENIEHHGAAGAVLGALIGSLVGTLAGTMAIMFIPGLGPALTGGGLMGVIAGAAAGAAIGAFGGPFLAMGFSENQPGRRDVHSGRTVLVVFPGANQDHALTILREHAPLDVHFESALMVGH